MSGLDAIVVFVFYDYVWAARALALLCTFSCSQKTKNKGTLVLAIYQLIFGTIGWLCASILSRHLGVQLSMNYFPNRHCLEIGAKSSLELRNGFGTLQEGAKQASSNHRFRTISLTKVLVFLAVFNRSVCVGFRWILGHLGLQLPCYSVIAV